MSWLRNLIEQAVGDQRRYNRRVELKLDELFNRFNQMEKAIMAEIDDLKAAVANDTTVEQSAITLISGFGAMLAAALANNDSDLRAAVETVATQVNTNASTLAAAVAANTPPPPSAAGQ